MYLDENYNYSSELKNRATVIGTVKKKNLLSFIDCNMKCIKPAIAKSCKGDARAGEIMETFMGYAISTFSRQFCLSFVQHLSKTQNNLHVYHIFVKTDF